MFSRRRVEGQLMLIQQEKDRDIDAFVRQCQNKHERGESFTEDDRRQLNVYRNPALLYQLEAASILDIDPVTFSRRAEALDIPVCCSLADKRQKLYPRPIQVSSGQY